jgi:hypothetical protein
MRSRTSPIVIATSALRAMGQLALAAAAVVAALAVAGNSGARLDPVVDAVRAWLVQVVTG